MIVAFGDLFNQINLTRYDDNGKELEHFLVPILYGGKEKYVSRLEGDPNLDKKVQITLPVMSYEMTNMSYDPGRKLNTNQRLIYPGEASGSTLAVWNPVPFDFDFSLYLYVRNFEDSAQIIEKIIPFFTPDYTVSVNLIPEMHIVKQLPIIMKDVTHDIDYEGNWEGNVRTIIWTLNFTIKGYLYGAISEPKIIRTSVTNILDDNSLQNKNIVATMSAGGNGTYKYDEIVYQGYSYETSTATANVVNWIANTRQLELTKLSGHFVAGQNVIGLSTNSNWAVSNFSENSGNLVNITVTPNPSNVVLPNNYTYTTVITEFPNTL
jgi:hypothetical protein